MRFVEIDLFGVYAAQISLMMVVAWMVTITLRRSAAGFGMRCPKGWCSLRE